MMRGKIAAKKIFLGEMYANHEKYGVREFLFSEFDKAIDEVFGPSSVVNNNQAEASHADCHLL